MRSHYESFISHIRREYTTNRTMFVMRVTIIILAIVLLVSKRTFWTPDTLFILLLIIAVVFGEARGFLIRFLPLISLLLLYEVFRGIADNVNTTVHFTEMIDADLWMFMGQLPTVVLQEWWWFGAVRWYDFYFYFLYMIHFLMPMLLAVLLWRKADKQYWPFVWALVGLSFSAFITYIIFPAAPPWMAKDLGYIVEPLYRVSSDVWAAMGVENFSEVYSKLPANPVAAVPSLHSAYPLLAALFITSTFGWKKYWWVYLYPISMWICVVYMGEHYVIDVILGALYAYVAYIASKRFFVWYRKPHHRIARAYRSVLVWLRLR